MVTMQNAREKTDMEAESLFTEYERKASDFSGWKSYYSIGISPNELFPDSSSDAQAACLTFITRHFEAGCKQEALNFPFQSEYEASNRSIHMVSLFLLGFHLHSCFSKEILLEFERNIHGNKSWVDFRYIWFLICLYHDTASCIETKEYSSLEQLHMELTPYKGCHSEAIHFYASDKLAEGYFNYCRHRDRGHSEHGGVGGYLLFNRLIKNFESNTKGHNWLAEKVCYKKGLCWRLICTPKVRHFWRCIFLWAKQEEGTEVIVQNSKWVL